MASFLAPPAAAALWMAGSQGNTWPSVLGWVSVRVFGWLAGASAAAGFVGGVRRRRWARVAFAAAVLVLLGWGWQAQRTRFEGTVNLGVGEASAQYRDVVAGSGAQPPALRLEVARVTGSPHPGCEILAEGGRYSLAVGRSLRAGGSRIRLLKVNPAPLSFLQEEGGTRTLEGYLKLGEDPGTPGYFQFLVLPHRFYLTPASGSGEVGTIPVERLHLLVTRGKLTLLDRDIEAGEKVPVDAFFFGFEAGAGWVSLRVETVPPLWPLVLAAGFLAAAGSLGWLLRGRT